MANLVRDLRESIIKALTPKRKNSTSSSEASTSDSSSTGSHSTDDSSSTGSHTTDTDWKEEVMARLDVLTNKIDTLMETLTRIEKSIQKLSKVSSGLLER